MSEKDRDMFIKHVNVFKKDIKKKGTNYTLYTETLAKYGGHRSDSKNPFNLFEADREFRKGGEKRMINPLELSLFFSWLPDHSLISGPFEDDGHLHVLVMEKNLPSDTKPFTGTIVGISKLVDYGIGKPLLLAEIK